MDKLNRHFVAGNIIEMMTWKHLLLNLGENPKADLKQVLACFITRRCCRSFDGKNRTSFIDYYLSRPEGIYYIYYNNPRNILPGIFVSKKTSYYLAVIELVSGYQQAREKLNFIAEWLN